MIQAPALSLVLAGLQALPEGVEDVEDPEPQGGSEEGGSGDSSGEEVEAGGPLLAASQLPSQSASMLTAVPSQQLDEASSGDGVEAAPKGGKGKKGEGKRAAARAAAACKLCGKAASRTWVPCACCGIRTHVECLARHFLQPGGAGSGASAASAAGLLPSRGSCPVCGAQLTWADALRSVENAGWDKNKQRGRGKQGVGGGRADAAGGQPDAAMAAASQQQQQGSPGESAAAAGRQGASRKPRGRKAGAAGTAAAAAAVAGLEAGLKELEELPGGGRQAAAAAPPKRRGRPRKLQPLLGPDSGSGASNSSSSSGWPQQASQSQTQEAAVDVAEALPWDEFGLSSPPGAAAAPAQLAAGSDGGGRGGQQRPWQQQQQQQHAEVVELSDSEDAFLLVPLAQRLRQAQQQHVQEPPPPQQQREDGEQGGSGSPGVVPPATADAIDLVSPSPLPLLQRLKQQQPQGGRDAYHSPRATPSPAPQRKLRKCFQEQAGGGSGALAAAELHRVRQQALDPEGDVIVVSDSE